MHCEASVKQGSIPVAVTLAQHCLSISCIPHFGLSVVLLAACSVKLAAVFMSKILRTHHKYSAQHKPFFKYVTVFGS
jgi:hypothetical protein